MRIRDYDREQTCVWCGKRLDDQEDILSRFVYDDVLCVKCRDAMKEKRRVFRIRGVRVESFYPYEGMGREMLIRYKELFDEALYAAFLRNHVKDLRKKYRGYTVVPVPGSAELTRIRGFSHTGRMAEELGLPVWNVLEKTEETEMKKLPAKERFRQEKLFRLKEEKGLEKKRILVMDDLMTTGATFSHIFGLMKEKVWRIKGFSVFYHVSHEKT